jgi:hypothetical protein
MQNLFSVHSSKIILFGNNGDVQHIFNEDFSFP